MTDQTKKQPGATLWKIADGLPRALSLPRVDRKAVVSRGVLRARFSPIA